jgi:hypothetical protein
MTTATLETQLHELRCDAQRSIRYHLARVRFFRFWSSLFSFIGLISGSSVVVSILATAPSWIALTAGAIIAATQAIELIWNISEKARLHSSLQSEFNSLEQEIVIAGDKLNDDYYRRLEAKRLNIETREPPIKRWLDLLCHNEVAYAMGSNEIYDVPFWPRLAAQWLPGAGIKPKRSEV